MRQKFGPADFIGVLTFGTIIAVWFWLQSSLEPADNRLQNAMSPLLFDHFRYIQLLRILSQTTGLTPGSRAYLLSYLLHSLGNLPTEDQFREIIGIIINFPIPDDLFNHIKGFHPGSEGGSSPGVA